MIQLFIITVFPLRFTPIKPMRRDETKLSTRELERIISIIEMHQREHGYLKANADLMVKLRGLMNELFQKNYAKRGE